jgi:hypothetical protein
VFWNHLLALWAGNEGHIEPLKRASSEQSAIILMLSSIVKNILVFYTNKSLARTAIARLGVGQ